MTLTASPRPTGPGGAGDLVQGRQVLPALDGALATVAIGVPLGATALAVALLGPVATLVPGAAAVAAPVALTLAAFATAITAWWRWPLTVPHAAVVARQDAHLRLRPPHSRGQHARPCSRPARP